MLTQVKPTKTLSMLLVDDDPQFRAKIRNLLSFSQIQERVMDVIAEANRSDLALSLTKQYTPDLILIDMKLIAGDGLSLLQQLKNSNVSSKILVLSGHQEDYWIYQAMQLGADSYIFKSQVSQQLPDAIASIMQNQIYLPPEVATGFFRRFDDVLDRLLLPQTGKPNS